jgi:uncharacterized protein YjbI with pentapeptide repeats
MEENREKLTKQQITALRTRWHERTGEDGSTLLEETIKKLKSDCKKQNADRPVNLDLRGILLANKELSNLDLSGYDFSYANLNQTNLTNCNCSYSNFYKASLEQAILDEVEFIGSDLREAKMNECSAKQAGFGGADLSHTSMINAILEDATLSRSTLILTDFRAANLSRARLSEADLTEAVFTRAILSGSDLKHSDVKGTNFELASMQGCRLLGIKNYKKADWIGADIRDLDLRGAYLVRRYIADENYLFEFQNTSKLHRVLYLVWWATSDCGRSILRWFVWLSCAMLIFAAVYAVIDIDYGDYKTWYSPIYFSVVTATTLGYGDVLPASLTGQLIVTLQSIIGYVGLGGLLSILGNKMARRAE